MDYFRPPFLINRPPLFQPRMEHFNLMHGPAPFHPTMSPFAMTTPSALSLYLQRPPPPPPPSLHLPMLGGAYMHSHNQHQPRDPRRQRPSKRVRQRMRRLSQRGEHGDESRDSNSESIPLASESGYDTAGDCQTPATPLDSPTVANGGREFPIESEKQPEGSIVGHCSQSSDSSSSMDLSETSLKKLLKDLHRCDVSISKYQGMLDKNCEDGHRNLQEMFSRLHDHLNAREQDLTKELNSAKEKAASILQHRQRTSSSLRQAAENDEVMLNETQILELKHQIKCFVTDRKVDEEIGTATYFKADSDDLIKHIMGFGKVIEARHQYTVWDENPLGMINMSKKQELFPPSTQEDTDEATQALQECELVQLESASKSQPAESDSDSLNINKQPDKCFIHDQTDSVTSPTCNDSESSVEAGDLSAPPGDTISPTLLHSAPLQPISSQTSPQASPARSNSKQAASSTNRHTYSYRVSATSSVKYVPKSPFSTKSGRPWHAVSKATAKRAPTSIKHKDYLAPKPVEMVKNKKVVKEKLEQQKENDSGSSLPEKKKEECTVSSTEVQPRSKYSRSELQTIQSRVKDSLRLQGVYLYDPVTGDGPLSTTSTPGASRCSTSSIDISGERGKASDQNNTAMRKKKTPTQLRRERKKRQKERERQQRELEKRSEDQVKEQTEDKDSETETKVTLRGDHGKQNDNEEQVSPQPASLAAETTTLGEGDIKTAATTEHHSALTDKLSFSDSESQPESSTNNSQDHSPTHSTSSTERTLDNDIPIGEDPQEARANPQRCHGLRKINESETTEEDVVFSEVTSTADRSLRKDGVNREGSPSLVMLTEEAASEVKINHKACHPATKPKTDASVLPTCVNRDSEPDGGTQNGIEWEPELELELKPEE